VPHARSRDAYRRSLRTLLRPVVCHLVARGVPYPALDEVVRELFVESAARDFPSDLRVSRLTGVDRKEVARLRGKPPRREERASSSDSMTTRLTGRWMATSGYVDTRGRPRTIPYAAKRPEVPSFVRLARELGTDVPPRSIRDQMLRAGAIEELAGGRLRLQREFDLPRDLATRLGILATDPAELFTTIAHNIDEPEAPWLQRKVRYDNIGADALPELREAARSAGEEFVRRANALLAARDRDRNPGAPGGRRSRATLGVYYCEADSEPDDPPRSGRARERTAVRGGRKRRGPGERST
jgi:hypothetical protein